MVKLWILLGALTYFSTDVISLTKSAIAQTAPVSEADVPSAMDQVTSVSQLTDVQPSDWAFQALRSLVERYGCVVGYANQQFQGDRSLSRYEFAAGVTACLNRVTELVTSGVTNSVPKEDLLTLQRLQEEFATELATTRGRVDTLEIRTTTLEANQFSTTTKLTGQVIVAVNAGGFEGDPCGTCGAARILSPTGAVVAEEDPNPTSLYRVSLFFNTSFTGTDQLQVRLTAGSEGSNDNAAGFLEPNFGSVLDFAVPGRPQFSLGRLFYTFIPIKDVSVTIGPQIVATDYVDKNSYANVSFLDFSTQALINNFPLFPRSVGAGAVVQWQPEQSPFKLRAVYVAGNAASFNDNDQRYVEGPQAPAILFPNRGGSGGLFGDPYQGTVEIEYSPSRTFALRLQYSGGVFLNTPFDVFGANFELALSPQIGIFGRYGHGTYLNSTAGDLNPSYWMAGIAFRDLFKRGALAGIAIGQPLIESNVGNATQANLEAFYNFPISNNIQVTPLIQVITKAGNQSSNGTIVTGTVRTVFSF
ncbi:MAG: iron uptake porin [Stenomitos rutilans HA7619-LM2]|jgi:porin|nr:iron uptake porin [Stenomitos rutilans HA7619-LM2]